MTTWRDTNIWPMCQLNYTYCSWMKKLPRPLQCKLCITICTLTNIHNIYMYIYIYCRECFDFVQSPHKTFAITLMWFCICMRRKLLAVVCTNGVFINKITIINGVMGVMSKNGVPLICVYWIIIVLFPSVSVRMLNVFAQSLDIKSYEYDMRYIDLQIFAVCQFIMS